MYHFLLRISLSLSLSSLTLNNVDTRIHMVRLHGGGEFVLAGARSRTKTEIHNRAMTLANVRTLGFKFGGIEKDG